MDPIVHSRRWRPSVNCQANTHLLGELLVTGRKGFLASPKENFLCGLYFYYNTHLVSSLRSPTYSVIRRSPSKWGLIIVAMLKLGFWTEIGVSFVAQFWHNFCHLLVASVICQIFLFRVYKILSEIINIRCLCRSEGSLCFKWHLKTFQNLPNFLEYEKSIWTFSIYSATLQTFFTMKLAQIYGLSHKKASAEKY